MKRLTIHEIKEYIIANYFDGDENVDACVDGDEEITVMANIVKSLEKLAEYEDAEENGTLIKLPCKVGDKVYQIKPSVRERYAIIEWSIRYFECYAAEIHFCDFPYTHFAFASDIGKTVFFTREKAEAALEKMKGE